MTTAKQNESIAKNFPFKTLIVALTAIFILFMFKSELKKLIGNANEVDMTFFGEVTIKVGKGDSEKLEIAQQNYETKINSLNENIATQEGQLAELNGLIKTLEDDIRNCAGAKKTATNIAKRLDYINSGNTDILKKSVEIKDIKMVRKLIPRKN